MIRVFVVLAVIVGGAGLGARWYASRELYGAGPLAQPTTVVIAKGSRTGAIGEQLEKAGVIDHG
ncbi:MAG TPA: aminodeoxychorismate lyase, partial [Alphaproteobacteria bacterium]|nr:aminodeoxychorismate lyase [Alphaproteobacteria bacterium]